MLTIENKNNGMCKMQWLNLECLMENLDIAKHILSHLELDDHLNLSRACEKFKNIVLHFVWKQIYCHVKILKESRISLITAVSSEHVTKRSHLLKTNYLKEFLALNAGNIKHFELQCGCGSYQDMEYLGCHNDLQNFKTLTSLSLIGVIVSNYDIKVVSENCPNLEVLSLENCVNAKLQTLIIGHDINVKTIAQIRNLKSFRVISSTLYNSDMHLYNYRHLRDIVRNLPTEELYLNMAIYSDVDGYLCSDFRKDNIASAKYLKENEEEEKEKSHPCAMDPLKKLSVRFFVQNEEFCKFTKTFFKSFQSLAELSIGGYPISSTVIINAQFFDLISTHCTQLCSLSLADIRISDFVILANLRQLSLKCCEGLSATHLEKILNEMNLRQFTTLRTKYSGNFSQTIHSNSMQQLELDLNAEQFVNGLEKSFPNLKILRWSNRYKNIKNFHQYMPNLEILTITENAVNIQDLLCLSKLHDLTLTKCGMLNDFSKLLQHSGLKILSLEGYPEEPISLTCLSTHLNKLNITKNLFKFSFNTWLDLLSENPQLELTVNCNILKELVEPFFLSTLINNDKFPARIKSILICGILFGK